MASGAGAGRLGRLVRRARGCYPYLCRPPLPTRHPEPPMFSENADLLDDQFRRWQTDPRSVDPTWQAFFAGMQFAGKLPSTREAAGGVPASAADLRVQTGAVRLVYWYRQAG